MKFTSALPSTAYFVQNYKKMLANSALHHNLFIFARIRDKGWTIRKAPFEIKG